MTNLNSISAEEYKEIFAPKKKRNQEESTLQKNFGQILAGYEKWGKLSADLVKYSYIANGEQRPATIINGKRWSKTGADLKKKGVKKGVFDYFFCIEREFIKTRIAFDIWLEAKSSTGFLTKEQKEFKARAEGIFNIKIFEFRSVEEGLKILKQEGILILTSNNR
ncbi:MAG: hypothetical protein EBS06_05540 [Proteobacteria bacterium]|nr:hypothetical protein [Pseudomonadota bacterium]